MALDQQQLRRLGISLVILHAVVVTPHSIAHSLLHIDMNTWQNVYIMLVILLAPFVSLLLLWKRWLPGFLVLALSMTGSFFFGMYYHFVASGPDNVTWVHTPPWSVTFQATAVLLAIVELAGALVGFYGVAINESSHTNRHTR